MPSEMCESEQDYSPIIDFCEAVFLLLLKTIS